MRPVIGILQCLDDRGRWRRGRDYLYADLAYARAVESAGGLALHLPIQSDAEALVARIDGLLLPGGDDLEPPAGHEYAPDVPFDPAPRTQLDFDRSLLAAALDRRLPVLGICYGMQLMALHHGGGLHYHLPADLPEALDHALPESLPGAQSRHTITVEPDSRLAAITGTTPAPVNSLHHQAVSEPGAGMRACAHAEDGVIEAIERDAVPGFELGVQWHPEKLSGEARLGLFRALVAACEAER